VSIGKTITYAKLTKVELTISRHALIWLLDQVGEIPKGFYVDQDLLEEQAEWPIRVRLTKEAPGEAAAADMTSGGAP
jgi:hypothetical protein